MSKYRPIYKCRLCGETFGGFIKDSYHEADDFIRAILIHSKPHHIPYSRHYCENGDIGLGDLLGVERLNREEDLEETI